jgi:hypothetical protein
MTIQHEARHRAPRRLFESGFASPEVIEANVERIIASRKLLHAPTSGPGFVQLIHGANEDVLEVGGVSVGEVRFQFDRLFNIDPAASPLIDGLPVTEDHVIRHGETLEFLNPFGHKGMGEVWTKEEFCTLFKIGETDFSAMVSKGLPVHRMEDGSIRITETQVDDFLDALSGKNAHRLEMSQLSPHPDLIPVFAQERRTADSLDRVEASKASAIESPYLNIQQASSYLKKTPKALYGLLERGRLKKMPGSYICYFTKESLDNFLNGETNNGPGVHAGRRKKS